jgi:hypothetical protein
MAKPLSEKSRIIRAAIVGNPGKSNKDLAEMLNDSQDRLDDKITFKPDDIAQQKQAMKKPGAAKAATLAAGPEKASAATTREKPAKPYAGKKRGRKPGQKPAAQRQAAHVTAKPVASGPVAVIDKVFGLAQECGGFGQLKQLVDRLAGMAQR